MKIAFAIGDLASERIDYTTTHLAMHALRRGHEVWYLEVDRFELGDDNRLSAHARKVPQHGRESRAGLMSGVREVPLERLDIGTLDVLFLRNDPAAEALVRPWAQLAGVNFGRLAMQAGVLVVNNPDGLYHAVNKLYLQLFPRDIRPRTLISRNFDAVRGFLHDVGGKAVVKPLRGSGGHNVFMIREDDTHNLRQIFEAVCHEGYLIAQEFLPEAEDGDTRLFLLEGGLMQVDGEIAAVHRVPAEGDLRSNLMAGGHVRKAVITDRMFEIAARARPQLQADDMFFVGLDVIGDRVVEVNVFSPGALIATSKVTGIDFGPNILESLERKSERHLEMLSLPD